MIDHIERLVNLIKREEAPIEVVDEDGNAISEQSIASEQLGIDDEDEDDRIQEV